MKKIIKNLAMLFLSNLFLSNLNAQTDLKIIDFSVFPLHTAKTVSKDSVKLTVRFKINKPALATKANLWLGTAKDLSDVFVAQPVFNTVNNTSTFVYGNNSQQIKGYEIVFTIALSNAQYASYNTASFFVETVSGQTSPHLYFNK